MSNRPVKPRAVTHDEVRKIIAEVLNSRKNELDEVVARAARTAVGETLTTLGVDTSNPIEAQATFVALRGLVRTFADKEFQADLSHLRTWRRSIDHVRSRGVLIIASTIITGAIAWMVAGFKVSITR